MDTPQPDDIADSAKLRFLLLSDPAAWQGFQRVLALLQEHKTPVVLTDSASVPYVCLEAATNGELQLQVSKDVLQGPLAILTRVAVAREACPVMTPGVTEITWTVGLKVMSLQLEPSPGNGARVLDFLPNADALAVNGTYWKRASAEETTHYKAVQTGARPSPL